MTDRLSMLTSTLASSLRFWRGTWGNQPTDTPQQLLTLFDREDDPECRLVREALTELNLDAQIYPCPIGGKRFAALRKKRTPKAVKIAPDGPLLHDPNTGQTLHGAAAIVPYLFQQYLGKAPPAGFEQSKLNMLGSKLASMIRNPAGIGARPSKNPKQALTLYSFESSPYSRPVRERLCALELPYHLINMGKLQWADMGPARMRLSIGPYEPVPGSKRDTFLQQFGKVQVPFLIDPNHAAQMFESQDILRYLDRTYAK
jgi:glutathione S-transferase